MTSLGFAMLILSWVSILSVAIFCFMKVFMSKGDNNSDD